MTRVVLLALGVVAVSACGSPEPAPRAEPAPSSVSAQGTNFVELSPEEDEAGWVGVVLPRESAEVAAQQLGRVRAVYVRAGAHVERGQLLATLETDGLDRDLLTAQAALRTAQAELAGAEAKSQQKDAEFNRRREAPQLFSAEQLHLAELEAAAARAEKEAAEARLAGRESDVEKLRWSLLQTEIRAPFRGTVALRHVDSGVTVTPGTPLIRLATRDLMVRFAVPKEQAAALSQGAALEVEAGPGLTWPGAVSRNAPEVDIPSQMVFFEARLEAAGPSVVANQGVLVRRAAHGAKLQTAADGETNS